MSKHTPGPWVTQDRTDKGAGFSIIASQVHFCMAGVAHYIGDADAKLIAAAPELYALAERIARLNKDAGEIGAGMLASLVDEATRIIEKVEK